MPTTVNAATSYDLRAAGADGQFDTADDLVYTHSSARLDTKRSLIDAMVSGTTVYTGVEPSEVKAQDLGDAVVLTGSCRISVMSNGRPNSFGVRFTDVYANKGGQWQMVTWQSTRLPE